MAVNYKNMQRFVRNTIHPYVVNLRDLWKSDADWLKSLIDNLVAITTNLQNQITLLDTKFTNVIGALTAAFNTHASRVDNPHSVKMAQTAQVSNLPPTDAQGSDGDFWIEYLD